MADWFNAVGITTVVMESTGVYWVPVYEVLESAGIEAVVANAREARSVPGRKSDVNDAQWLQRLHACGLLRASFRPGREIAALRAYLRLRERHLDYAAAHIQHMQKALTFMNLQLHHVVSDVTGATGLKIVRAIIAGERDAKVLAAMLDIRCKATPETIEGALQGNYQPEHIFAWQQSPLGAPTRRWVPSTDAWPLASAKPRRSQLRHAKSPCCSTRPCALASTTAIPAPITTRKPIALVSCNNYAGVPLISAFGSKRCRVFLRKATAWFAGRNGSSSNS